MAVFLKEYHDDARTMVAEAEASRDSGRMSDIQSPARLYLRCVALALFLLYLAVFPGSTITVARDQVPTWGEWMGGGLLLLQGAIVLCWLLGSYGRRGALAAVLIFLLAWGVEHLGVTSGFPFGRYTYTAQLQPQLLGAVPLAIPCAWLMVAVGAWQIADCRLQIVDLFLLGYRSQVAGSRSQVADLQPVTLSSCHRVIVSSCHHVPQHATRKMFLAATLVLLLDLQIEPVATAINRYWVWLDGGAYYGVPAANFVAWWAVGLVMAVTVKWVLGWADQRPTTNDQRPTVSILSAQQLRFYVLRFTFYVIPAALYLLNTLMFAAINLARGYFVAGVVGVVVLVAFALAMAMVAIKQRAFTTR
jgi:putative membrane protein